MVDSNPAMAEPEQTKKKRTPRDFLRIAFRHRGLFAVGTSLFAIAALAAVPYIPQFEKKYTGTAIFERRSDAAVGLQRRGEADSFESIKLTLEHELAGRKAVERAVGEPPVGLGLTKGAAFPRGSDGQLTPEGIKARQELVKRLQEAIKTKWDVRSEQVDLVSVSFTHKDPELAEKLPNTLVRNYINRVSQNIVERLTASRDFLEKQVGDIEERLSAATKRRIDFETEHGGMLPDSPGALQEKMREVSGDIDSVRRQHTTAQQTLERLNALAKKVQENPDEPFQTVMGPNPELERLKEQLRTYKDNLQNARTLSHMTEKHPTVITLREKIAEIEAQIEKTPEETVLQKVYGKGEGSDSLSMALAAARSEVEMTEGELTRLQKRLDDLQELMANYSPIRQMYLDILGKVRDLEAEKKSWQERLSGVEMALSAEVAKRRTHLNAVQLAEKQFQPSSPKLHYLLGFALVGGLAFGGGLVLLANMLDRSVWTPQDAEKAFGVPVCGVIGEIVRPTTRLWRGVRRFLVEPATMLVLLAAIGIGCLNTVLWLQYPEQYAQWTSAPLAYLGERTAEIWPTLKQAL